MFPILERFDILSMTKVDQMCNYEFVGIWYPIFAPSRCEDANPLQVAIESMVSLFEDFENLSEQQLSAEFCDYLKVGQSEKHAFKDYESVHTIQVWVSRILAQQFGVSIYVVGSTHLFVGSMRKMLDAQLLVGHHLPGQSRSTETCVDNGSNAHLLIVDAGVI